MWADPPPPSATIFLNDSIIDGAAIRYPRQLWRHSLSCDSDGSEHVHVFARMCYASNFIALTGVSPRTVCGAVLRRSCAAHKRWAFLVHLVLLISKQFPVNATENAQQVVVTARLPGSVFADQSDQLVGSWASLLCRCVTRARASPGVLSCGGQTAIFRIFHELCRMTKLVHSRSKTIFVLWMVNVKKNNERGRVCRYPWCTVM